MVSLGDATAVLINQHPLWDVSQREGDSSTGDWAAGC
jgi:hypothetical protein